MQRPSVADIEWYEIAFKAVTAFVENTFANPAFLPQVDAKYCSRCIVQTSQGQRSVVVSIPVDLEAAPEETFHEHLDPQAEDLVRRGPGQGCV